MQPPQNAALFSALLDLGQVCQWQPWPGTTTAPALAEFRLPTPPGSSYNTAAAGHPHNRQPASITSKLLYRRCHRWPPYRTLSHMHWSSVEFITDHLLTQNASQAVQQWYQHQQWQVNARHSDVATQVHTVLWCWSIICCINTHSSSSSSSGCVPLPPVMYCQHGRSRQVAITRQATLPCTETACHLQHPSIVLCMQHPAIRYSKAPAAAKRLARQGIATTQT